MTLLPFLYCFVLVPLSIILAYLVIKVKHRNNPILRVIFQLNTLFRRLATFPFIRVSSPQLVLTSEFGMRSGVTPATNHQNKTFNLFYLIKIWNLGYNIRVTAYSRWIKTTMNGKERSLVLVGATNNTITRVNYDDKEHLVCFPNFRFQFPKN